MENFLIHYLGTEFSKVAFPVKIQKFEILQKAKKVRND